MNKTIEKINWKKMQGLVPAIIQDAESQGILMLGYMTKESLENTFATKNVWFFSRSKKRLWMKGETSGNVLKFIDMKIDCDGDALLVKALPQGPTCHLGSQSCFKDDNREALAELYGTIVARKKDLPAGSYTVTLFNKGLDKICAKVAEESGEVIKAAQKESGQRLTEEGVDLLYHLFVLLAQKDISYSDFLKEIKKRRK
jgi:phosphoribosyl-ATP pyrophosphohydrolase/phosphoribosyl-AMP cyclohydrolase